MPRSTWRVRLPAPRRAAAPVRSSAAPCSRTHADSSSAVATAPHSTQHHRCPAGPQPSAAAHCRQGGSAVTRAAAGRTRNRGTRASTRCPRPSTSTVSPTTAPVATGATRMVTAGHPASARRRQPHRGSGQSRGPWRTILPPIYPLFLQEKSRAAHWQGARGFAYYPGRDSPPYPIPLPGLPSRQRVSPAFATQRSVGANRDLSDSWPRGTGAGLTRPVRLAQKYHPDPATGSTGSTARSRPPVPPLTLLIFGHAPPLPNEQTSRPGAAGGPSTTAPSVPIRAGPPPAAAPMFQRCQLDLPQPLRAIPGRFLRVVR